MTIHWHDLESILRGDDVGLTAAIVLAGRLIWGEKMLPDRVRVVNKYVTNRVLRVLALLPGGPLRWSAT